MIVSRNPKIPKMSKVAGSANDIEDNQSELRIKSHISLKSGASFNVKSNAVYKISFIISGAASISDCSILSFSHTVHGLIKAENVACYEAYFTKDFLNKEAIELSEKFKLFKSQLPMLFLMNQNEKSRVKEIFESMLDENARVDLNNEMMRTLIHELILFSRRLISVDTNSVQWLCNSKTQMGN